ncbi:MAG: glycosyltransferase family 2 protein [Candidatus Micrarchaeia archaeon]
MPKISPYISIVIPTLNEEDNIGQMLQGVKKVLDSHGYNYELIVVDKYSRDNTVKIAREYGAKILFDGIGKGSALIKGIKSAKGSIIISMDADLSHQPNELLLLIAGIEAGYDVCMGSRFLTGGGSEDISLLRKIGNTFFVKLVNLIYHTHYTDMCYGYRSFDTKAVKKLKLAELGFGIETEINIESAKRHLKVLEVPSYEKQRGSGSGKLRTFRDGWVILRTIIKKLHD